MQQVMEVMEKNMDNSKFTIDEFALEIRMGRTVFYQKLKAIIGLSPVDFIREMRIKRAKQLIDSGEYNVSTVAYMHNHYQHYHNNRNYRIDSFLR